MFSGSFIISGSSLLCEITCGNISSSLRYSYLSILPDDNTDIFAAVVLMSYCNCSFSKFSSIFMINFNALSDEKVESLTKANYCFIVPFLQNFEKSFNSISDEPLINSSLLKLLLVWYFQNEIVCSFWSTIFSNAKTNTWDIFNFLPIINSSFTIGRSFLLLFISQILHNQYFSSHSWITLLNTAVDILLITRILNGTLWILKVFTTNIFTIFMRDWHFASFRSLSYKNILPISHL